MAGLWTEVCVTWPTLNMLDKGYNIFVVEDACGATSQAAHEAALSRMAQAGAARMTTIPTLLEFQRDWARHEHYDALMGILKEHPAPTAWESNTPTRWCITRHNRQKNHRWCRRSRTEVSPPDFGRIDGACALQEAVCPIKRLSRI